MNNRRLRTHHKKNEAAEAWHLKPPKSIITFQQRCRQEDCCAAKMLTVGSHQQCHISSAANILTREPACGQHLRGEEGLSVFYSSVRCGICEEEIPRKQETLNTVEFWRRNNNLINVVADDEGTRIKTSSRNTGPPLYVQVAVRIRFVFSYY